MQSGKGLRVGIVGGSIAGCAMAAELSRIGCQVSVFERSASALCERGAGIATPMPMFESWRERALIDHELPYLRSSHVARVTKCTSSPQAGRVILEQPSRAALLRWGTLFSQLRARVPEGCYLNGVNVQSATVAGDDISLQLESRAAVMVDLAIFCDGYRSSGRQTLLAGVVPEYSGYVLWRGMLAPQQLPAAARLEGQVVTVLYVAGYAAFYLVPGGALNWALYLKVPAAELPEWLLDADGVARTGSVPTGSLRAEQEHALKLRAAALLPADYVDLVQRTADTSLQALFDCQVDSYARGRLALAGDAGALALPTSASGALKAIQDASELADALRTAPSVALALASWERARTRANNRLVRYGRQLARALLSDELDWSTQDAGALQQRMAAIVTG